MISPNSIKHPRRGLIAPFFILLSLIDAEIEARLTTLRIIMEIELPTDTEAMGKTGYGAILLMIAFVVSTLIIGLGARILGLSDVRIRVGLSITFFILVFVTLVVYENLKRRYG